MPVSPLKFPTDSHNNYCYTTKEIAKELEQTTTFVNSLPKRYKGLEQCRRKKGGRWLWHKRWRLAFLEHGITKVITLEDEQPEMWYYILKAEIIKLRKQEETSLIAERSLLQLLEVVKFY